MQEYRINYTLLIGLIIGTFVCSGAIFGVHMFQTSRQSGWLISEAEKASADKNYRLAAQYYQQYGAIHNDDLEVQTKLANTFLDILEQDNAEPEDVQVAFQQLEGMLRIPAFAALPETKSVRRRLVNFYGKGNYTSALDHLKFLLERDHSNAELQVLRATYLAKSGEIDDATKYSYTLIGYDPKKDTFDVKKATAPNAAEV